MKSKKIILCILVLSILVNSIFLIIISKSPQDNKIYNNLLVSENYQYFISEFNENFNNNKYELIFNKFSKSANVSKENIIEILDYLKKINGEKINSINISKEARVVGGRGDLFKISFLSEFSKGLGVEHFVFEEIDGNLYLYNYEIYSEINELLRQLSTVSNQGEVI